MGIERTSQNDVIWLVAATESENRIVVNSVRTEHNNTSQHLTTQKETNMSRTRTAAYCHAHGVDLDALDTDLGVRTTYPLWRVLAWLGYDRVEICNYLTGNDSRDWNERLSSY